MLLLSLLDDFSQISELCLKCKNLDQKITNTWKLGITPDDKPRTQCDKYEKGTDWQENFLILYTKYPTEKNLGVMQKNYKKSGRINSPR